ncbi:hypothetical protein GCM10008937_33240 [Deinococcus depolymerans]|uniref:Uncharacterized protein n=1 Tax=Deinococcus depolymerans TaxID=392408 RepID=A0ABN1CP61_9DEIO
MLEDGGALEEFGAVATGGEEEMAFVVRAGLLVEIQDVHGGQYFILGGRSGVGWGPGRLGGWVPLRGGGVGA